MIEWSFHCHKFIIILCFYWYDVSTNKWVNLNLNCFQVVTVQTSHNPNSTNLKPDHTLIHNNKNIPVIRTGIYRHSQRDLICATRKIKCANEPVVHNKHQSCNSNCLQCPIYAPRHAIQWRRPFFLRQNNKSWEILHIFTPAGVQPYRMTFFFRDSAFSYTIYSARPIDGVHESCFCFAVMESSSVPKYLNCNLVRAAATDSIQASNHYTMRKGHPLNFVYTCNLQREHSAVQGFWSELNCTFEFRNENFIYAYTILVLKP